jgi:glycosyltransferase involved in cell wall biosynthesis
MANVKKTPTVTLFIPTYNAAATVGETLASLVAQTYRAITIVVVDNASSDGTVAVAAGFAAWDTRVSVLSFDTNVGGEGNFTRCLQRAEGDYAAVYHADDIYEPDMVARQVAFLERHPEVGAVFTRAHFIGPQGELLRESKMPALLADCSGRETTFGFGEVFNAVLKEHNFFICPSAMARAGVYREHVATWDAERFGSSADLGVWLRILEKYRIGIIPETLMRYRLAPSQGSVVVNRLRTAPADFFRVVDHYLAQGWVRDLVTPESMVQYQIHQARDLHTRVKNALMLGDRHLARRLARDAWKPALFVVPGDRGTLRLWMRTWFSTLSVNLLVRFPMQRCISALLYHLKYVRRARKLGKRLHPPAAVEL